MFVHLVIMETEAVMGMGPEIQVAPFVTQMRRIVARLQPARAMQDTAVLLLALHVLNVPAAHTRRRQATVDVRRARRTTRAAADRRLARAMRATAAPMAA